MQDKYINFVKLLLLCRTEPDYYIPFVPHPLRVLKICLEERYVYVRDHVRAYGSINF